ncbi:MAG TPA: insulinase family protein, partial [Myxococcota bacterium]|nr:insulinase family protein [Myxococcota bacterium]
TFTTAGTAGPTQPLQVEINAPAGKAPAPDLAVRVPKFNLDTEYFAFPSGLAVMFQRDATEPVVAITAVTDHGSSDDPIGKEGIAHLVEHLWFRSEHGDLPKVWDLLEAEMGCDLNAFTQYDITAYMTVCPSFNLEAMMKLESLRITDTVRGVTEDMVTTEVEVVRNEIRMRGENFNIPFFTVWEYLNGHIFPEDHPYHRPVAGDHTTIRNCRVADVQKFTEDYYTPENTTIMVVGDLKETTPAYYLDLIVRSFDLSLLDPELKPDHIRRVPREGITNPDPNNPEHWWMIPMNPRDPNSVLPYKQYREARRDTFADLIPPNPVTDKLGVYTGPVEDPTVVVGWTLPAGYQGYDTLMQVTGSILSNVVSFGLDEIQHPDVKEFQGCGILPSKRVSLALCVATLRGDKPDAKGVAEKIIDQVATLYDPNLGTFLDVQLSRARMEFLAQTLRSIDLFAAVGAGRATEISQFAHFTGDPNLYTAQMKETMSLQGYQIRELADKWLQRKRAGMALINPMDREQVALLSEDTAGSGGHSRGGGESSILNPSIPPEQITPEYLRSVITVPDRSKIVDLKLPNDLRVVIMPHGDTPVVRATVVVNGGTAHDDVGLTEMMDEFVTTDEIDPLRIAGAFYRDEGITTLSRSIEASSGNLDGALWMLREKIDTQRMYLAGRTEWIGDYKSALKKQWLKKDYHQWHIEDVMSKHFNPGHPLEDDLTWQDLEYLKKVSPKDLTAEIWRHWQPANATLLIVGRVDPREAQKYAIKYFGGWRAKAGAPAADFAPVPPPSKPKDRAIYVFDDPGKTQTEVYLKCQLTPATMIPSPRYALLGDIARMTLFSKLREEAGVVYSPYAYAGAYPGGTAVFIAGGAIQNDSAVFAMDQMLAYIERAKAGDISDKDLRIKKLSLAAGYVLGQQSVDQMSSRLAGIIQRGQGWDYFDKYAEELATTTVQDLANLVGDCSQNAFISLYGPKDKITAQLDAKGYTYEVIDFKERGEAIYAEADPKGFEKYKKAKEKDEAKKAKEEGEDAEEGEKSE